MTTIDRRRFRDRFAHRAIVLSTLPRGTARDVAVRVNTVDGHGDASLRTRAEQEALFDLLHDEVDEIGAPDVLTLADDAGRPTAVGRAMAAYEAAVIDDDDVFASPMWMVQLSDWSGPLDDVLVEDVPAPNGARVAMWPIDAAEHRHIPPEPHDGPLFASTVFSLQNTGNRTLRASKRSWRIELERGDDEDAFVGLDRINLKAMVNDPSQMREALAWRMFDRIGVVASRHTYARCAVDDRYLGLFSFIEDVDGRFLKDRFGRNDEGNLYKAACGSIGCATLAHRQHDGDDTGRQYRTGDDDPTYRLRTNEDDDTNTYDDLAAFIRVINGIGLPGHAERFASDAFRERVEGIMNVWAFLRWAGANVLMGSWDNYFATPSNYYLYNSGRRGAHDTFVEHPYFTFIPWDYDNSFGIDYFGTRWQDTDLLDWPANTAAYHRFNGHATTRSTIPLVENLLRNPDFVAYYLDHVEQLLDTEFRPEFIADLMVGATPSALWSRVARSAYLEADTPHGRPFTGRQFTNDQVYWSGYAQHELVRPDSRIEGIVHFVRMRRDRAAEQLTRLRRTWPRGASGAVFTGVPEPLPPVSDTP